MTNIGKSKPAQEGRETEEQAQGGEAPELLRRVEQAEELAETQAGAPELLRRVEQGEELAETRAGAPELLTRVEQVEQLAEILARAPIVAVDTESNSLYAYREQVCLVQFSTTEADYLVDALDGTSLAALGRVFADERVEKVFHAAEYDVICLRRDFDTMLAARILGRAEVGLSSLLESEFGVRLNKRFQRANWGQRPLTAEQLDYARMDTHYLIALRERLRAGLEQRGLLELAQEDFARLAARESERGGEGNGAPAEQAAGEGERSGKGHNPAGMDGKAIVTTAGEGGGAAAAEAAIGSAAEAANGIEWWRVSGARDLEPRQAAILAELCVYRDRQAHALNRPLFKVMGDKTLTAIAQAAPKTMRSLGKTPGMTKPQLRRHGQRLLEAVQRGLAAPPLRAPRQPRPDGRYLNRLAKLRQWRTQAGEKLGVPSEVALPRDLLLAVAQANPRLPEELAEVLKDSPYRLEHFGAEILAALNHR